MQDFVNKVGREKRVILVEVTFVIINSFRAADTNLYFVSLLKVTLSEET